MNSSLNILKNNIIKNNNSFSNLKNQKLNNTSPKIISKKGLEKIHIVKNLIHLNSDSKSTIINQKTEINKYPLKNLNIINKKENNRYKKNKDERKHKIKIKFKKKEISPRKNFRSLSKERDKRKIIKNINNKNNSESLIHLNSKLDSIINDFNNMQSLNMSLKFRKTLSSSIDDLNDKNDKLINKIRNQKKIREMLYN